MTRTWHIDHLDGWRAELVEHPTIDIIVAGNSRIWRAPLETDIRRGDRLRLAHHCRTAPHRMPDRSGAAGVTAFSPQRAGSASARPRRCQSPRQDAHEGLQAAGWPHATSSASPATPRRQQAPQPAQQPSAVLAGHHAPATPQPPL